MSEAARSLQGFTSRKPKPKPHKGLDTVKLIDPATGEVLAVACYHHANMIASLMAEIISEHTGEDPETIEFLRVGTKEEIGHSERGLTCCLGMK